MSTFFTPQITAVGKAAALAQDALGLSLTLTHVGVGSASYTPTAAQVALVDLRHTGLIGGGINSGSQVSGTARIQASSYSGAAFDVGEIGFYAGDPNAGGTLVMVLSQPGTTYASLGGGMVSDLLMPISLLVDDVPSGSVTIIVDANSSQSSAALSGHLVATNPHPQYSLWSMFVGSVMMFQGATPPRGMLPLLGQAVSRSDYPELYAYAVNQGLMLSEAAWLSNWTMYSVGDGSTTFRLPDYRGEFPRFADMGRGIDSGRVLSSWQDWSTGRPRNTVPQALLDGGGLGAPRGPNLSTLPNSTAYPSTVGFARVSRVGTSNTTSNADSAGTGVEMDIINVMAGDVETRARNVALFACVFAGPPTLAAAPVASPSPAPSAPSPAPTPAPAPSPSGAPTAAFSASPRNGEVYFGLPATVYFTDQSAGSPTSWLWDFGDGTTSTAQHPSHAYGLSGSPFTVSLTVTNASGSNTKTEVGFITTTDFSPGGI